MTTGSHKKDKPNITFSWEFIDPARAASYLSVRHPNQRRIRQHRVKSYMRDLESGTWSPTHEAVAFDENGNLIDAQHRLTAIVQSGIGAWMPVARGVPARSIANIGTGLVRGAADGLLMAGCGERSNAYVATAQAMHKGPSTATSANSMTREELLAFVIRHEAALDFVNGQDLRMVGITKCVRAAIARAYYHVDRDRLGQWCLVLKSGMPVSAVAIEDSAAIAYRDYLTRNSGMSGNAIDLDRYCKAQTAITHFVERKQMTKVYGTQSDLFPLPA